MWAEELLHWGREDEVGPMGEGRGIDVVVWLHVQTPDSAVLLLSLLGSRQWGRADRQPQLPWL